MCFPCGSRLRHGGPIYRHHFWPGLSGGSNFLCGFYMWLSGFEGALLKGTKRKTEPNFSTLALRHVVYFSLGHFSCQRHFPCRTREAPEPVAAALRLWILDVEARERARNPR